jgi:hypothetical protein
MKPGMPLELGLPRDPAVHPRILIGIGQGSCSKVWGATGLELGLPRDPARSPGVLIGIDQESCNEAWGCIRARIAKESCSRDWPGILQ